MRNTLIERFDEGADVPCGGVSLYSTPECRSSKPQAFTGVKGVRFDGCTFEEE